MPPPIADALFHGDAALHPRPVSSSAARGMVASVLMAAGFAALYLWALHLRHSQYETYAFDLGLLGQVTWNNLHGRWFETTVLAFNYLADHLSPVLVLVSPLFLVWPDVEALFVPQALAAACAGVGVYLATRRQTGDSTAALLVQMAYHAAPATGWVVTDEFHPISLAMPAITFATALLWAGRVRLAAAVAALALLASEEASVWVAPFGILLMAEGRRRAIVWGPLVVLLAVAWLAVYLLAIVPAVRPPELAEVNPHPDIGVFAQCGNNLRAVAACLLDLQGNLRRATTTGDLAALANLLAPTGGLGLLGPSFLVAAPRWLVLLLGDDPPNYQAHYVALLAPAAYLAAAEAIGWMRRVFSISPRLLAGAVAASSLAAYFALSPLPGSFAYRSPSEEKTARIALMDRAVELVPAHPDVSVAATSKFLPRLALRSRIYLGFVQPDPPPDYRIVDLRDPYPITGEDLRRYVALFRSDPGYRPIFDQDDILVLKREYQPPDRRADEIFGGVARLVGYSIAPMGQQVRILLYWRLEATAARDYHYFVHLDVQNGRGFSQKDGELARGHLPATRWSPGTEVREEIVVAAPPLADWDRYRIEVGWYDLETGHRLKLPDGRDHAVLPLAATDR